MKRDYKADIMALIEIKEQDYCNMQYETGLQWLEHKKANWVFEDSKLFWNWWKNQWVMRDKVFLSDFGHLSEKHTLRLLYNRRNMLAKLVDIYPPSVIMNESYHHFTNNFIKKYSKQVHHGQNS